MSRILVTGCNGFVGSHICQQLMVQGHTVTGIDINLYQWRDDYLDLQKAENFCFLQGDITDPQFIDQAVDCCNPQMVIHLASVVGVNHYLADPMAVIEVNILGLRNLLKALKGSGIRVVFSSTSEVYGKNPQVPWSEDSERVLGSTSVGRWSYSTSKAVAEHMLWACAPGCNLEAVVVRYFNLYGPRQRPDLLVPAQIKRSLLGKELVIYDGGQQTRCLTYVEDAVQGTLLAAFSPRAAGRAFNIGAAEETTVAGIAELIGTLCGDPSYTVRYIDTQATLGKDYEDIPRRVPDVSRALHLLGWQAVTPLREGLSKTINWWRREMVKR